MKATAFAPGHISGFFEPVYRGLDIERSGSRGSGITISLGATSQVNVESASQQTIEVIINNKLSKAPVTKLAVTHILGTTPLHITIDTKLDLPVSQGFGMSAAGALSATLALAKTLQLPREMAIKAAHYAEVQSRTGLGDVVASCFGGIEIRREAGLPPWGMIEHIPGQYDIVVSVIGSQIKTKNILSDFGKINTIITTGRYCTKKILENPSIGNLFSLSQHFTRTTGLADPMVLEAIETANHQGMASMCMLGNSVFAIGDTNALCKTLAAFGKVWVCSVDAHGACVTEG